MTRAVKVVGWGLGLVVLLLVVATLAIKVYCTKERVLGWVVPPLEEKLHRTVTVADVGAGLTGLHLDGIDVRVAGAKDPLLTTRRVQASWNPWSLLSGTVEITEVRLVEPRVRVVRLPDGTLDVDDLGPQGAGQDAKTAPAGPAELAGRGGGPPVDVVVRVFALENGRAEYLDRSAEPAVDYVLEGIDARVTEIAATGPIPFELSARLPLSAAARFTSRGTVDVATGAVETSFQIVDFELVALNQVLAGELQVAAGVLGMDLAVKAADPEHIAVAGEVKVPGLALVSKALRGASTDINLQFDATADLAAETVSLKTLGLDIAKQSLTGTAGVTGWGRRPQLAFQLRSEELRVDELLAVLPPVESPGGGATEGRGEPRGTEESAPAGGVPLDAEGDLAVALLSHGNLKIENLAVHLALKADKLRLDPVTAELYGGTLAATAAADLASQGPAFEVSTRGENLNLGRLLAALNPQLDGSLTGTAALELTARGLGGDLAALESRTKLTVKDGKLVTHPLVQEFTELFKIREYRTLNFYDLLAEVGTQAGVASVDSLIFRGPKLQATGKGTVTLQKPEMDLRLAVALPREAASRLVGRQEILDTLTDAQGWTRLPLRLEGSPDAPRYGVDNTALEKVAAKALEKKAGEFLEKAPMGEKEKELLDKGIRSLFGR